MKKKQVLMFLVFILIFILSACASSEEAPAAETAESAAPQQTSVSGMVVGGPISAGELEATQAEGKQFVVYFQGKKLSETEQELQEKLELITGEYSELLLCDYYTMPISDYSGAKDILGGNLFGLVLFRPEGAIVLSGDSKNDVGSAFNRFFEYELVAPDDHGLPIISYEEVVEKINGGEEFILYIGRDTCPQCRLFAPNLERGIVEKNLQTPSYYFNVQSYATAIDRKEEGAEVEWLSAVAAIGFMGTPSLLYFNDGTGVTFDFFNNLFPEDAKSQEEFDESNRLCLTALENWISENGIK